VAERDEFEAVADRPRERRPEVAPDRGVEDRVPPPLGVLAGQLPHTVRGEDELEVGGLLRPERAVVVERGDPFGDRDEVRPSLPGHADDEVDDRPLRDTVVPRGKRIVGQYQGREEE
jgi:hypothetical protein